MPWFVRGISRRHVQGSFADRLDCNSDASFTVGGGEAMVGVGLGSGGPMCVCEANVCHDDLEMSCWPQSSDKPVWSYVAAGCDCVSGA